MVELILLWLFCSIKIMFGPVCRCVGNCLTNSTIVWLILQLFTNSIYSNCWLYMFVMVRFLCCDSLCWLYFDEDYVNLFFYKERVMWSWWYFVCVNCKIINLKDQKSKNDDFLIMWLMLTSWNEFFCVFELCRV